jgi:hypothetical protein
MKIMALRVNFCLVNSSIIFIPFPYKISTSTIKGLRKTSILIPGCFGPCIIMDSQRYLLFWHNLVGKLYIVKCWSFHLTDSFQKHLPQNRTLSSMRWMWKLHVNLLVLIWRPLCQQFIVLWVWEQMRKAIYNREVSHDQGRNFTLFS